MSSPEDAPGTSSQQRTKKRFGKSSPRSVASGESNKITSSSPDFGVVDKPSNGISGRSPGTLRDRILLANANAVELSTSELDDTCSSSDRPTPTQQLNGDGDREEPANGPSKSKKKKSKKPKERRQSKDAALMGWTGSFPNLSSTHSLESNSDLEPQQSTGNLREIGARGLSVFPREEEEYAVSSASSTPNSHKNTTATTTTMITPSPTATPEPQQPQLQQQQNRKRSTANEEEQQPPPIPAKRTQHRSKSWHQPEQTVPRIKRFISLRQDLKQPLNSSHPIWAPAKTHSAHPPTPKPTATDEYFRLPFKYGWKRELVLPSCASSSTRRVGDVFFISPDGKKLRSREDIIPLIKGKLTIDHFCFMRQSQEVGPPHELVRRAIPASKRAKSTNVMGPTLPSVSGKRVPKPKVPKGASPPHEGWTATMAVKGNARVLAAINGGQAGGDQTAGGSRKRSSQAKQKTQAKIKSSTPATVKPLPPDSGDNDADNEDDDNASGGSLLEIGEEIELPGQLPPAQLLSDDVSSRLPKEQEVVVIGGRKAIAILASPPRPRLQVVPREPNLESYDRYYNKRILPKKISHTLMESLGEAHNGCQVLMAIMKTMTLKERANMAHVCKTWAMVSRDRSVWRSVCLRDTRISSWIFCLRELARHRTRELDMLGVIYDKPELRLTGDLRVLKSLRVLRTDACESDFLHLVLKHLPQLLELRATCTSSSLSLGYIDRMDGLKVLRLNMTDFKASLSSMSLLGKLTHLTELSLRGVSNLGKLNVELLKPLIKLETLVLGSCVQVDRARLGQQVLPLFKQLKHFRLENEHKTMAVFPIHEIMQGLAAAGQVKRLELVNVDVDGDFSQMLSLCPLVEELLLMPKCMHNTANMTNAVMQAISDNAEQLKVFRLGLVAQLLSAANNLCKGKDVIPVRRPVPGIPENDHLNECSEDCREADHTQCVAYLPVERLESILHHMMPQGWLTVAKIAMRDTTKLKFLIREQGQSQSQAQAAAAAISRRF